MDHLHVQADNPWYNYYLVGKCLTLCSQYRYIVVHLYLALDMLSPKTYLFAINRAAGFRAQLIWIFSVHHFASESIQMKWNPVNVLTENLNRA